MKKTKIKLIFALTFILMAVLISCNNKEFLRRMQENEEGVHNPNTIEELKSAILKYEKRVEDIMIAENRIAIWYKMLGARYAQDKMYKKALDCFIKSLEYYPNNHNLYYQAGLCAANLGKNYLAVSDDTTKTQKYYYDFAERAYTIALSLQSNYTKAAYALGVLYVHELQEPEKAIKVLLPVVNRESKNYDVLFVLGSAYYLNKDFDEAINTFKFIVQNSNDENVITSAKENILQIEAEQL